MKRSFKKALCILLLNLFFLPMYGPGECIFAEDVPVSAAVVNAASAEDSAVTTEPESSAAANAAEALGGDMISVSFKNADILEVVAVFAEKTGLNIVSGPDVKALVNIELNNMPWEKALDVILKNYNLTYKRDDKIIRIMTLEQLKSEEEKIPLLTKVVTFNFAKAEDIKTSFNSMLSPRGKIEVNNRTNSLIITDLPENVDKIETIANSLDSRTPQVMIEALMADVTLSGQDQLGIQWKVARHEDATAPFGKSAQAIASQTLGLTGSVAGAITFGQTILKYTDLTYTLQLWQEQSRVNILAHPLIMTLDNQSAHIELIEEIPYTQQTQSTASSSAISTTAFKEAGIKLDVTPHITTKDNYISMNLKVEQSFRSGFTPDNQPIIDSRKAETNLLVKDGETIVIGGLRKKEDTYTIDKIPFLGDVPLLGVFFRRKINAMSDVDLLIFVTPKIITEPKLTTSEQDRLEQFTALPPARAAKKAPAAEKKVKVKAPPKQPKETSAVREEKGRDEDIFYVRPPD
jgi:type IV pilus assembly protein PilQ